MSLSNTTVKAVYSGDNANRTFAIPFDPIVDDSAETIVYVRNDADPANPVVELQVEGLGNDYTLSGAPDINSFHVNVLFNAGNAPTSDETVIVMRAVPKTQTLDLAPASAFQPEALEQSVDKVVAMTQEIEETLKRVPKLGIASSLVDSGDLALPEPVADTFLSWNAAGTALENKPATALSGAGDVVGPASSTDEAIPTFNGTSGTLLQNSSATINPSTGAISGNSFTLGKLNIRAVTTTPVTILVYEQFVTLDSSGGTLSINMPSVDATNDGVLIKFKKITEDFSACTLIPADSDTIGGFANAALYTNGEELTLVYNNATTDWIVYERKTITEWVSYTPTITHDSGAGDMTPTGKWRRVGDTIECQGQIDMTGTTAFTQVIVGLPASLTVDESKFENDTADGYSCGFAQFSNVGTDQFMGSCVYDTTDATVHLRPYTNDGSYIASTRATQAAPFVWAATDYMTWLFSIPITGWNA